MILVKPDALALDFDGVLCNGLREYFQTSLRAYRSIWSDALQDCPLHWQETFGRLRPIIETGWEMPVVLRALQQGYPESDLLHHWTTVRSHILAQDGLIWQAIGQQVDSLRDGWIAADLEGWLALHSFYPGVVAQLQQWCAEALPVFIITTKESRFVQALLTQIGIPFPSERLFGKDCQQPKTQTLRQLLALGYKHLWFVEDRLATLTTIQAQPDLQTVSLFLADWGYNTATERAQAIATPTLHRLSLAQFAQPFEDWTAEVERPRPLSDLTDDTP